MSIFNETNDDATTGNVGMASAGPKLGFLGAWEASYDAQVRASSLRGMERMLIDEEDAQVTRLKQAGVAHPERLGEFSQRYGYGKRDPVTGATKVDEFWKGYRDVARYYVDGETGDSDIATQLAGRNAHLETLKQQHPDLGIKTYGEMFDSVRSKAQRAELVQREYPTSIAGDIGSFLGGAVAGIDPRYDPLNFATLPIGGVGKTAAARIATQGGAQGAIEAVNQLTGVQETRRLQGLDYGVSDAAMRIGGAAIGGAVVQGLGEAAGAFVRSRWFRSTAKDPAPPAPVRDVRPIDEPAIVSRQPEQLLLTDQRPKPGPDQPGRINLLDDEEAFLQKVHEAKPFGPTRVARERSVLDLDHVATQLDDFAGPAPWEVKPQTDTAPVPYPTHAGYDEPLARVARSMESVDDIARRVDPETFRIYDKLLEQQERIRGWIADLQEPRRAEAQAREAELVAQIEGANKRRGKVYQERLDALREFHKVDLATDTGDIAALRKRLQELDYQARDLAPVVSRAYAAAKGEWAAWRLDPDALKFLRDAQTNRFRFREDRPGALPIVEDPNTRVIVPPRVSEPSLAERVPLLQHEADAVAAPPKAGADAADRIAAIVEAQAKVLTDRAETFHAPKLTEDGQRYIIGEREVRLDEKITVETRDGEVGEMTLKRYFETLSKDEDAFKAAGSCSNAL